MSEDIQIKPMSKQKDKSPMDVHFSGGALRFRHSGFNEIFLAIAPHNEVDVYLIENGSKILIKRRMTEHPLKVRRPEHNKEWIIVYSKQLANHIQPGRYKGEIKEDVIEVVVNKHTD